MAWLPPLPLVSPSQAPGRQAMSMHSLQNTREERLISYQGLLHCNSVCVCSSVLSLWVFCLNLFSAFSPPLLLIPLCTAPNSSQNPFHLSCFVLTTSLWSRSERYDDPFLASLSSANVYMLPSKCPGTHWHGWAILKSAGLIFWTSGHQPAGSPQISIKHMSCQVLGIRWWARQITTLL